MEDFKDFKDNTLYKISMTILEYIVISLFILATTLCSLGLLFYTAVSSSYYYYYKKERDNAFLEFKNLFKGIKQSYKQTIPLWIIQIIVLYMGYVNYTNFGLFPDSPILYYVLLICTITLSLNLFYSVQLVTYFDIKISRAIALSTYFLITYLISTITIVILFIALFLSISLQPPLILVVIGIFIQLSSKIFIQIFKKHSPEEVNEHEEQTS